MSNLQRLTNNAFGIRKYLESNGFDVGGKGKKPNEILIEFLKEKQLKYEKWNPIYKGFFTAELSNASTVSEHLNDFKNWVSTKKMKQL
jgi:hypothetical protein